MSLKSLRVIYNNAKKNGYVLDKNCDGNWLKCKKDWIGYTINKPTSVRSELWKEAKKLGYLPSLYSISTNIMLKEYIMNSKSVTTLNDFIYDTNTGKFSLSKYSINEIPDLLYREMSKINMATNDYVFFLLINGNISLPISTNTLGDLKEEFDPNTDNFYTTIKIRQIETLDLIKEKRMVKNIVTNGFLPYQLTERAKEFQELVDAWYRYVPNESSGLDCIGNCIKIAETEEKIPKGSFDKYVAFKLNNNNTFSIRQKDWKEIANILKIDLIIHKEADIRKLKYRVEKPKAELELYSYLDHCFLYERTIFSAWSIDSGYNEGTFNDNVKVPKEIYNKRMSKGKIFTDRSTENRLTAINFIRHMIGNEELTSTVDQEKALDMVNYDFKLTHESNITSGFKKNNESTSGTRSAKSPFGDKGKYSSRIFADYETIIVESEDKLQVHKQDMLVTSYNGRIRTYISLDVDDMEQLPATKFLNDIFSGKYGKEKNHIVIFHNLGYDINFIMKDPNIIPLNRLSSSASKTKCFKTMYFGNTIYFKDSYSVINFPLSSFNQVFGFTEEYKKGVCPYNFYTKQTIKTHWGSIKEANKHIKESDKEVFLESIKPYINPSNKKQFNHNQHRLDYCIQDVKVLEKGYNEFRNWVTTLFNEDLDYCVSIPQIAFNHMYNNNVFDDVCATTGITQHYLQNFIVGGRCMSANNEKYIVDTGIQDLDANSLYPSAMCRDDFDIPLGKGRKLTKKEIREWKQDGSDLDKYSSSYLSINITKVGKKRDFPCIHSRITGFTNEPDPEETIYVGKIMMQEIIKYHGDKDHPLEYKVLGGLVFDKGNKNCCHNQLKVVMEDLYKQRCELRSQGKKSEQLVKLIMNAAYGRMIMKPHNTDEIFFKKYKEGETNYEKYTEYTHRHFNHIKGINKLENFAIIEKYKSILSHENYSTLGINVLDMTKRIMNEVMYLAEDNNIKIYYQDTDSMHIDMNSVDLLSKLYEEKYNRKLCAKGVLGQFCTDFDVEKGFEKPYAKLMIIIGKKCYLDVVESQKIDDPNIKNIDYVVRMKGIPNKSIIEKANKACNGSLETLYRNLYNGKRYRFDMLADGGVSFEFNNFEVTSKMEFFREIEF